MFPASERQAAPLYRTAHNMVAAAVAITTGQTQLASPDETLKQLRQGNPDAIGSFRGQLARQIAAALLMLDPYISAVYEERDRQVTHLNQPIRLWVIARHRSVTLYTSIDELNAGLVEALSDICDDAPATVIQSIVVDERDSHLLRGNDFWNGSEPVLLSAREQPEQNGQVTRPS